MAHWAELGEDGIVLRVIVCDADDGADGTIHPPAFCTETLEAERIAAGAHGGTWQRTYYSTKGHTFAGIGYQWDEETGDFIAPVVLAPEVLPET